MSELRVGANADVTLIFGGRNGFTETTYILNEEMLARMVRADRDVVGLRSAEDDIRNQMCRADAMFEEAQREVVRLNAECNNLNAKLAASNKNDACRVDGECARHLPDCSHFTPRVAFLGAPKWRPIETAPQDSTMIMLGAGPEVKEGSCPKIVTAQWVNGNWWNGSTLYIGFTHWMPLPEPPR